MCTSVLSASLLMYRVHAWCPWRPESIRSPGPGATTWMLGTEPRSTQVLSRAASALSQNSLSSPLVVLKFGLLTRISSQESE